MFRVPSVRTLVVREPAAARGDTRNRVEHGVRVAGVAQVDEAAIGRVHEVRWKRVVVEKGRNVVLGLERKVVVHALDNRSGGGSGCCAVLTRARSVGVRCEELRAEKPVGGINVLGSDQTICSDQ